MRRKRRNFRKVSGTIPPAAFHAENLSAAALTPHGDACMTFHDDRGIRYEILRKATDTDNGTVQVGGMQSGFAVKNVVIPAAVKYEDRIYDVTGIGDSAFEYNSSVISVTIPATILSVGNFAFMGCKNLTEVTLADGLGVIGNYMFEGCASLKSIRIPNSLTSMGACPFAASGITEITFAKGVTNIDGLFENCNVLETVKIPATVEHGFNAFCGCSSLKTILFENGLHNISEIMFAWCTALKEIVIPAGVKTIESGAFSYCGSLKEVIIYYMEEKPVIEDSAFPADTQVTFIPD